MLAVMITSSTLLALRRDGVGNRSASGYVDVLKDVSELRTQEANKAVGYFSLKFSVC
jgi:hypothetical protein